MMQEISLNILDVAENSVKAGASLIQIEVDERPSLDRLTVLIGDNGCGMTASQVSQVTDPFFTSRTTRKVGLGVPFLKMAAEMTGGNFTISSEKDVGTVVTAVFGYSHIDRMPLGDMTQTLCTLIQCNPDIDFLYTHRLEESSFVMDTREFRSVLEGVSLNTPEVMAFIKEYLTENFEGLKNGARTQ